MNGDRTSAETASTAASEAFVQQAERLCKKCGDAFASVLLAREVLCGNCFLEASVAESGMTSLAVPSRRTLELEQRLERAVSAVEWLESILRDRAEASKRRPRTRRR